MCGVNEFLFGPVQIQRRWRTLRKVYLKGFLQHRFLSERVNMYSTIDNLFFVRDTLNGKADMAELMGSCFGSLFRLPVRWLLTGKVVPGMLTRQVVTKKKYKMWPVF